MLDGVAPGAEDNYIYSIFSGQRGTTDYEAIGLSGRAIWQDGKNIIIREPRSRSGGTAFQLDTIDKATMKFAELAGRKV
jgi:hypothetical protein